MCDLQPPCKRKRIHMTVTMTRVIQRDTALVASIALGLMWKQTLQRWTKSIPPALMPRQTMRKPMKMASAPQSERKETSPRAPPCCPAPDLRPNRACVCALCLCFVLLDVAFFSLFFFDPLNTITHNLSVVFAYVVLVLVLVLVGGGGGILFVLQGMSLWTRK